jgi:hypothetical protein
MLPISDSAVPRDECILYRVGKDESVVIGHGCRLKYRYDNFECEVLATANHVLSHVLDTDYELGIGNLSKGPIAVTSVTEEDLMMRSVRGDVAFVRVHSRVWSYTGIRMASIGYPHEGTMSIVSRVGEKAVKSQGEIAFPAPSTEYAQSYDAVMKTHTASTVEGVSGAPVYQGRFVVGIHTGTVPKHQVNQFTPVCYYQPLAEEESPIQETKWLNRRLRKRAAAGVGAQIDGMYFNGHKIVYENRFAGTEDYGPWGGDDSSDEEDDGGAMDHEGGSYVLPKMGRRAQRRFATATAGPVKFETVEAECVEEPKEEAVAVTDPDVEDAARANDPSAGPSAEEIAAGKEEDTDSRQEAASGETQEEPTPPTDASVGSTSDPNPVSMKTENREVTDLKRQIRQLELSVQCLVREQNRGLRKVETVELSSGDPGTSSQQGFREAPPSKKEVRGATLEDKQPRPTKGKPKSSGQPKVSSVATSNVSTKSEPTNSTSAKAKVPRTGGSKVTSGTGTSTDLGKSVTNKTKPVSQSMKRKGESATSQVPPTLESCTSPQALSDQSGTATSSGPSKRSAKRQRKRERMKSSSSLTDSPSPKQDSQRSGAPSESMPESGAKPPSNQVKMPENGSETSCSCATLALQQEILKLLKQHSIN